MQTKTTRTRIISSADEVCERLATLSLARPVVRRGRATVHFLRFLRSMRLFAKAAPAVHWLNGIHDYRHRLLDLGVYLSADNGAFGAAVYNWQRLIANNAENIFYHQLPVSFEMLMSITPESMCSRRTLSRVDTFRDENFLRAIESGLGFFVVAKNAVVLFPRPEIRLYNERHQQQVLHSLIGPAVRFPNDPASDQFWIRGVRVPEFVVTHPERITLAHIRAARSPRQRQAMIERYGLLRWARERHFRPVDEDRDLGAVLHVAGGKVQWNGLSERRCIVEMINSTPEPDGTHRHFARHVPNTVRTAREAVAWTFGLTAEQYHPDVQT